MPLIWCLPEVLVTAELSTAFPVSAGSVAWVEESFGSTAGLFKGYLSWCSGVLDNSVYPALFYTYLVTVHKLVAAHSLADADDAEDRAAADDDDNDIHDDGDFTSFHRTVFIISVTIALACMNYRGLAFAGNVCVAICVFSLTPFAIMIVLGAFEVHPSRWFVGMDKSLAEIDWPQFLNVSNARTLVICSLSLSLFLSRPLSLSR
jgi:amino acid transporter